MKPLKVKNKDELINDGVDYSCFYKKTDAIMPPMEELIETRKAVKRQVDIVDENIATLLDFYGSQMLNLMPENVELLWQTVFTSIESMSDKDNCDARNKFNEIYGG